MLKIILTGPESTGKSTICKQLAEYFKTSFIGEFARTYITNLDGNYNQNDLLKIAKEQLSLENKHKKGKNPLIDCLFYLVFVGCIFNDFT